MADIWPKMSKKRGFLATSKIQCGRNFRPYRPKNNICWKKFFFQFLVNKLAHIHWKFQIHSPKTGGVIFSAGFWSTNRNCISFSSPWHVFLYISVSMSFGLCAFWWVPLKPNLIVTLHVPWIKSQVLKLTYGTTPFMCFPSISGFYRFLSFQMSPFCEGNLVNNFYHLYLWGRMKPKSKNL